MNAQRTPAVSFVTRGILFLLLALLASCGACGGGATGSGDPPLPPPDFNFDADRAFADLEAQVDFGPRNPGSAGHAAQLAWMKTTLGGLADEVVEQPFSESTYYGGPYDFTNLIAVFSAEAPGDITMLGAHWDTRPVADRDPNPDLRDQPIPGANDGASGVAILMELARVLHDSPPSSPVYLAFFDAEDSGNQLAGGPYLGYCIGSTYMANNWPGGLELPDEVIVLDLVGGTAKTSTRVGTPSGSNDYFDLPREGYSMSQSPALVNEIWGIANQLDHEAFRNYTGSSVIDDHRPFQAVGISAIDIIDFRPPVWHTMDDTPEYCEAAALQQVGETMEAYLYGYLD